VKPASSKGNSIDDIHLTEDELGLYLDLAPFLNPSPYIVPEDMSLAKVDHAFVQIIHSFHENGYVSLCLNDYQVYNLFRHLGLRHIFVVPRPSRVVGLITRKDLLLEVISHTFALKLRKIIWLAVLCVFVSISGG
jgi:chloride channel 7